MANFRYNELQEEVSSPVSAECPDDSRTPITSELSTSKPQYDSLQATTVEEPGGKPLRLGSNNDNLPSLDSVRYTALKPTYVRELADGEVGQENVDQYGTDSSILVTLSSDKKRRSISKIYLIICSLLISSVVLVAFGLIYVFIIVPAYKENSVHPDPRVPSADLVKNLGELIVQTSCGLVRGQKELAVYVFRGIPYAVPPTGSRRWKPPEARESNPSACWQNIYNATKFGSKCVQPKFSYSSLIEGSEDCLFLNIWTPTLNSGTPLPVMVWFHSGDFVYGSGHMQGMSPTPQTALTTNAVYVSFNYRLGAFGFLALDELREEAGGAAGNYGFMDQQLILKWVKTNIRQFGGNENMVTIFGHGSGATSVHALLLSPESRGLFQKVWLTSPVTILNKTVDDACRDNKVFLTSTGCRNLQCLRKLSAAKVMMSSPWQLEPYWNLHQLFNIPKRSQPRNGLPIFDGATYFDLSGLDTLQDLTNMTWDEYNETINKYVDGLGSGATNMVKSLYSYEPHFEYTSSAGFLSAPGARLSHLIGDIKNKCPAKLLADNFVSSYSNASRIYLYVADIFPSANIRLASSEKNTFTGWDIVAFFDTFLDLGFVVGQGELNFQNILREEIMSFVRSGQPDASRWKTADVNTGVIGRDVTVTPVMADYFSQCVLWKQYGFFNYSWSEA